MSQFLNCPLCAKPAIPEDHRTSDERPMWLCDAEFACPHCGARLRTKSGPGAIQVERIDDMVTQLGALLQSVGARVTIDPRRSISAPCYFCNSTDAKRDLVHVGRYFNGDLITRPVCAGCRPVAECRGKPADSAEICICAAIRLPDGRVIRGHSHGDCIATAKALVDWQHDPKSGVNGPPWTASMCEDQGFITSRNRYVGREEGLALQHAAGIRSACPSGYRERQLFSEDLY